MKKFEINEVRECLIGEKGEVSCSFYTEMKALEFLKYWNALGYMPKRRGAEDNSNSELFRLLKDGAVQINGGFPKPNESIRFPITQLVFFPKGNKVTQF